MADKLSERLETLVRNACPGWHAAETIREAAELARRVEDAQIREVEEEMHGLVIRAYPLKKGQRVRIVPEAGLGGGGG